MTVPHVYQRAIELGPELELRVRRRGDGRVERARVREGLSVGRSAACGLVVDDKNANMIHARVVPGIGGGYELRCVGMARLMLADYSTIDQLNLRPGMWFHVGDTPVECEAVDAPIADAPPHPSNDEVEPPAANAPAAAVATIEMPRLVVCPTCFRDMSGVPVAARFCPKCGVQLPARNAEGFLIPPEESSPLFHVYRSLRDELEGKLADETPQVASSLIILAYANAMLNLGWRYEHGRGALRNVEEAARCYAKAGRLSEAWGKA